MGVERILVGDDLVANAAMRPAVEQYLGTVQSALPNIEFAFDLEFSARGTIEKALGGAYSVVVTDLDYGIFGGKTAGYDVIDALQAFKPRPIIILCSSNDDHAQIAERTTGKIDYHCGRERLNKLEDLAETLIKHYSGTQR